MKIVNRTLFLRQHRDLLVQIQATGPVFRGSVAEVAVRCGKASCRCQRGQTHRAWYACYRQGGKTKVCYLPASVAVEARALRENWNRLKALLEQLAAVQVALWKEQSHEPQTSEQNVRRPRAMPHAAPRESRPVADSTVNPTARRKRARAGTRRAG